MTITPWAQLGGPLSLLGLLAMLVAPGASTPAQAQVQAQVQAQERVALELVLAVDVSSSVDDREYQMQMDGIAAGFRDPKIVAAIERTGAGSRWPSCNGPAPSTRN